MLEELLRVLLLAVVQGITEFLPISSTGHLIVLGRVVALSDTYSGTFEIFIQVGSVVAVVLFYWAELWQQARTVHRDGSVRALWLKLLIAFVPAAGIGFLFADWIEVNLFNSRNVALALIVGGVLFIMVERLRPSPQETRPRDEIMADLRTITYRQAIIVGLWQILALLPGMSRSGMTIIGGMLSGLQRATATLFTFYLAIPTLGVATVYSLLRSLNRIPAEDLVYLFVGAVIAAIVSYLAIAWLLRYVSRNTFVPFGVYRIGLGLLILALLAGGLLPN
ncbi:MAG: undecaprenyl-diphosphate phosphatase [Anaerolineae bacterium]